MHLAAVLEHLRTKVIRLKEGKCHFMEPSNKYLGHCNDANSLHTTAMKCKAIVEALAWTNATRSFLGLLNYYGRFIPNLATTHCTP